MDRSFPVNYVRISRAKPLRVGTPLPIRLASGERLASLVLRDRLAGVLVLQHGVVRMERYGLGAGRSTRWTSFSVTKSITATLAGFALRDGLIVSADDPVTRYLPELAGSAYEGVTVRQLVTMTSGVRWMEDYSAPDSDNVKLYSTAAGADLEPVVEYMRHLTRDAVPGTRFVYKTGESDLLGSLIRRAVGSSLSDYLQRRLWRDMGAGSDAAWIAEKHREFGGSGLSATLRDFGRFGDFVRTHRNCQDGVCAWLAAGTTQQIALPHEKGRGYGYGWWTYADGSFAALGIFGQSILVDPARELVIVTLGAWPEATGASLIADRQALWQAVRSAIDRETPKPF